MRKWQSQRCTVRERRADMNATREVSPSLFMSVEEEAWPAADGNYSRFNTSTGPALLTNEMSCTIVTENLSDPINSVMAPLALFQSWYIVAGPSPRFVITGDLARRIQEGPSKEKVASLESNFRCERTR